MGKHAAICKSPVAGTDIDRKRFGVHLTLPSAPHRHGRAVVVHSDTHHIASGGNVADRHIVSGILISGPDPQERILPVAVDIHMHAGFGGELKTELIACAGIIDIRWFRFGRTKIILHFRHPSSVERADVSMHADLSVNIAGKLMISIRRKSQYTLFGA